MNGAPRLMRPAARSAAMRPHSACSPSPWPAPPGSFGASRWFACLFFVRAAPARWKQSYWMASAGRAFGRGGAVTVTALVTGLVTPKPLQSLDNPNPLPRYHASPAHVIRSRAHTCAISSLPLVTWEQERIVHSFQGLEAFPTAFPRRGAVGTWERSKRRGEPSDCPRARSNKVEAGYGDPPRSSGDARQKFRGAIARRFGRGELRRRIQRLTTRRGANGGKPPFTGALGGHVGRLALEGSAQAPEFTALSAARLKLGRLWDHPQATPALLFRARHPGAPHAASSSRAPLAMDALAISFGHGASELAQADQFPDRFPLRIGNRPQNLNEQRGPGGARFSNGREIAGGWRNREAEKRAGAIFPLALGARPHEAGEACTLGQGFRAVKSVAA